MAEYIPIDQIVTINPGVIRTGTNPLALNGLLIDDSEAVPVGNVLKFDSADSVSEWFGNGAYQTALANVYFNGFTNCTKYPGSLFFAGFARTARAAWARGQSIAGTALDGVKISLHIQCTVNGNKCDNGGNPVDLTEATSFADVAARLTAALFGEENPVATMKWDNVNSCFITTTTETGATASISQFSTFGGGTVDKLAALGLDACTLSQGAAAQSLTDVLDGARDTVANWAMFSTVFQATKGDGLELAQWAQNEGNKYGFVFSDNDPNCEIVDNSMGSAAINSNVFAFTVKDRAFDSTICVYDPNESPTFKAFVLGIAASIDWDATNGRATAAFRRQGGLAQTCRNLQIAENLLSNGYSYYGAYAGRGDGNTWNIMYNGKMLGNYPWFDTFINQIYLNNQLKLSLFSLLIAQNSIPYNDEGYAMIRAAVLDPVAEALNNGTIRVGVSLSESQKVMISSRAGKDISNELYSQGWYLSIGTATAQVRERRASPPLNFFYCDGGAIQQITLPSLAII